MFASGRGGGAKLDIQHGTYSFFFSDGDNACSEILTNPEDGIVGSSNGVTLPGKDISTATSLVRHLSSDGVANLIRAIWHRFVLSTHRSDHRQAELRQRLSFVAPSYNLAGRERENRE
jgi:hypothetical protein